MLRAGKAVSGGYRAWEVKLATGAEHSAAGFGR